MFFKNDKLEQKAKELSDLGGKIISLQKDISTHRDILSLIFDTVPAMIFYKDRENRIVNINEFGCQMFGVPREQIIGHNWKALLDDSGQARKYFDNDLEVMRTGQPKKDIVEVLPGTDRTFLTPKMPMFDNGKVIGVLGFSTEITKPLKDCEDGR